MEEIETEAVEDVNKCDSRCRPIALTVNHEILLVKVLLIKC